MVKSGLAWSGSRCWLVPDDIPLREEEIEADLQVRLAIVGVHLRKVYSCCVVLLLLVLVVPLLSGRLICIITTVTCVVDSVVCAI